MGAEHAHDDESDGQSCRSDHFVQLAAAMVGGSGTMPKSELSISWSGYPAIHGRIGEHGALGVCGSSGRRQGCQRMSWHAEER